jgi:hypothetical protein
LFAPAQHQRIPPARNNQLLADSDESEDGEETGAHQAGSLAADNYETFVDETLDDELQDDVFVDETDLEEDFTARQIADAEYHRMMLESQNAKKHAEKLRKADKAKAKLIAEGVVITKTSYKSKTVKYKWKPVANPGHSENPPAVEEYEDVGISGVHFGTLFEKDQLICWLSDTSTTILPKFLTLSHHEVQVVPCLARHTSPDTTMIPEHYRRKHKQCLISSSTGSARNVRRNCAGRSCSGKRTQWKCIDCGKNYCKDDQGIYRRDCFYSHICKAFDTSGVASKEWKEEYKKWEAQRVAIIAQENEQLQVRQEDRTQNN